MIAIETASEPWRPVHPGGVGVSILTLGLLFPFVSTLVVGLRVYVRLTIRCFGVDDWLMCVGTLFGLLQHAAAIWGAISGLGTPDALLTVAQSEEASKAVFVWEIAISLTFALVKTSICCALMRIAQQRWYRGVLWALITITWLTNITEIISTSISYQSSSETCTTSPDSSCVNFVAAAYVGLQFGVYISVDAACTILPIFLLWNLQMGIRAKISTGVLLGLGSLATIASIIRLPLSLSFNDIDDRLYHRGRVIVWAIVEVNVGIIAGSMPTLRKLFRWVADDFSWTSKTTRKNQEHQYNLVTIGQIMGRSGTTRLRTPDEEMLGDRSNQKAGAEGGVQERISRELQQGAEGLPDRVKCRYERPIGTSGQ